MAQEQKQEQKTQAPPPADTADNESNRSDGENTPPPLTPQQKYDIYKRQARAGHKILLTRWLGNCEQRPVSYIMGCIKIIRFDGSKRFVHHITVPSSWQSEMNFAHFEVFVDNFYELLGESRVIPEEEPIHQIGYYYRRDFDSLWTTYTDDINLNKIDPTLWNFHVWCALQILRSLIQHGYKPELLLKHISSPYPRGMPYPGPPLPPNREYVYPGDPITDPKTPNEPPSNHNINNNNSNNTDNISTNLTNNNNNNNTSAQP